MGHLTINNSIFDKYFNFLFDLDINSKKRLIIKLTESIKAKNKPETDLDSLFGAWEDDKDSDEIIKEIRDSRVEKRDIKEFQ